MSPPVRLRMMSTDKLCARSMIVEWEDGSNTRQRWVSSEDPLQNGWYDNEKLLPPSATNISVQFKVKGPNKGWDVCAVDRHNGCSWVMLGKDRYAIEIFCFRVGAGHFADPIDAAFELKGPLHRCFVHRAWNAAHPEGTEPEDWERWDDEASRPPCEGNPATLLAASAAAVAPQDCGTLEAYVDVVSRRLQAAVSELLLVHRETLRALRGLDSSCTGHWFLANMGTSFSAGLMVAAVPATFLLPPLGLGLAIAGSVAGSAAMGGDTMQERWSLTQLRRQLSKDGWEAYVTAELLKEWLRASEAERRGSGEGSCETGTMTYSEKAVGMAKSAALATAMFGDEAAAALPVLGPVGVIVGAVMTTGIAIHGWTSQKFSQKEVRGKMREIKDRLVFFQFLLARLGRLECPVCLEQITADEECRRCGDYLHYCHARCRDPDAGEAGTEATSCPICLGQMDPCCGTLAAHAEAVGNEQGSGSSTSVGGGGATASSTGRSSSKDPSPSSASSAAPPAASAAALGGGGLDDSALWGFVARLEALAAALSTAAQSSEEVHRVAGDIEESKAARAQLERLASASADRPDGGELVMAIAETLERMEKLVEEWEAWKADFEANAGPAVTAAEEEEAAAASSVAPVGEPQADSGEAAAAAAEEAEEAPDQQYLQDARDDDGQQGDAADVSPSAAAAAAAETPVKGMRSSLSFGFKAPTQLRASMVSGTQAMKGALLGAKASASSASVTLSRAKDAAAQGVRAAATAAATGRPPRSAAAAASAPAGALAGRAGGGSESLLGAREEGGARDEDEGSEAFSITMNMDEDEEEATEYLLEGQRHESPSPVKRSPPKTPTRTRYQEPIPEAARPFNVILNIDPQHRFTHLMFDDTNSTMLYVNSLSSADAAPVSVYNASAPAGRQMQAGDYIVEANGQPASLQDLNGAIMGLEALCLVVQPPRLFTRRVEKRGDALGLDMSHGPHSRCLCIQSIKAGAVQRSAPDVRAGDRVVAVNGREGSAEALASEIRESDVVDLRFSRP